MTNPLRRAAAVLRSVPIPKLGVNAGDYARALHDWHRSTGSIRVYLHAANLTIECALLDEAQDTESKKLLAHLDRQVASSNEKLPTDKMPNGRSRADHNAAMAELMRRKRAAKKAEAASNTEAQP
jgi:hypothetical protein